MPDTRVCAVCDREIPPARLRRWPEAVCCSADCTAEYRREYNRAAVERHRRRKKGKKE